MESSSKADMLPLLNFRGAALRVIEQKKEITLRRQALFWNVFLFCVFTPVASFLWYECEHQSFYERLESSKEGSWVSVLYKLNTAERKLISAHIKDLAFEKALKETPDQGNAHTPLNYWDVYAYVGITITR
jgi:hypothetical protein